MLDLLLTNARIVDGTGNPWRKGCVGVRDGRIVAVGSAHDMPEARTVLDIGGNILCPGFIDSHSHSDLRIIDEPLALPKIMQGITTENVGLDSMSVAPISDKNKEPWSTSISGLDGVAQKPWGWNGFASYLNALDAAKPSVNLSSYVGLGTVRLDVMGMEDRPPTAEELRLMEESVARCMEEGARGISAGLIYTPNKYQSTEELVALAKVAARYDGILDVHMRNEADHMAEALEEVIHIGRETGIRILVTHFKLRGRRNWGTPAGIRHHRPGPRGRHRHRHRPVSVRPTARSCTSSFRRGTTAGGRTACSKPWRRNANRSKRTCSPPKAGKISRRSWAGRTSTSPRSPAKRTSGAKAKAPWPLARPSASRPRTRCWIC
ncbi:MAG: N-acyl-D-amino-acid deacylase family protein [Bilophila wadsworthia]